MTLRLGTRVEGFLGDWTRVRAVATSDGELECDAVIVCLHKLPTARWPRPPGSRSARPARSCRRAHAHVGRRSLGGGRRRRGPARALDAADPRPTGSHAYAQGRTAAFNAAGPRPRLRPGLDPVGPGGGRLHDRRLLDRRDARDRDGHPVRPGQGRRRLPGPLLPGRARTYVKLLAEPDTLRLIGGQIHGGEGVKERCDFLAFAAKRGATLEDLAWMENIYSPPIGALFEPIAIAAQNGLAAIRDAKPPPRARRPGGMSRLANTKRRLRERSEHYLLLDAARRLGAGPGDRHAVHGPGGARSGDWLFVPLYRRVPWNVKRRYGLAEDDGDPAGRRRRAAPASPGGRHAKS